MNQHQTTNPIMAQAIEESPVFSAIEQQVLNDRRAQRMRYKHVYGIADSIVGQQTLAFILTIEQGTDFDCFEITASAYSYNAGVATTFPIPNALGSTAWAGRGLSVSITDQGSSRTLTNGFIPFELLGTPGYGINFQRPFPFRYFFRRNSKIKFDVRNRDANTRTHEFAIALSGYKTLSPEEPY